MAKKKVVKKSASYKVSCSKCDIKRVLSAPLMKDFLVVHDYPKGQYVKATLIKGK